MERRFGARVAISEPNGLGGLFLRSFVCKDDMTRLVNDSRGYLLDFRGIIVLVCTQCLTPTGPRLLTI